MEQLLFQMLWQVMTLIRKMLQLEREQQLVGVSFSLGAGGGLEAHFNSTYIWRLLEWRNAEMCIE